MSAFGGPLKPRKASAGNITSCHGRGRRCASGLDPKRAANVHGGPDDPGSGGSDQCQARAGTDPPEAGPRTSFEADFDDGAHGYQPGRSATHAIKELHRLIKLWLKAPVEERDGDGKQRLSGGRTSTRGTPQGGVASPLLANISMNRFLKHWRRSGRGEVFHAHIINYADDFVILSQRSG